MNSISIAKHWWPVPVIAASFVLIAGCTHEPEDISSLREVCFDSEILPIFQTNCAISGCHNSSSSEEDYVLDSYGAIVSKGIVPGNAGESELYKVLFASGEDQMPPSGYIPESQRTLIRVWIEQGAKNSSCVPGDTTKPGDEGICFETEVFPLIVSNCAQSGCHDAQTHEEGLNFTTYSGIRQAVRPGDPGDSELYESISKTDGDEKMPPPPYPALTASQISTIYTWILEGAKETTCESCDTTQFSFAAEILPLVESYCQGCHNSASPSGGVLLTSYDQIKAVADNGKLLGTITGAPGYPVMPPAGTLTDCQITQVKNWIDDNAPND